ncbi:MAG: hypothetical protein AB1442_10795, partial [Nitrospirota bacterium]
MSERIESESGVHLSIDKRVADDKVELTIRTAGCKDCLLHWGVRRNRFEPWEMPPQEIWPRGSSSYDNVAVQTPLSEQDGQTGVMIKINRNAGFGLIDFVLFFPQEARWDNNHGRNYHIEIPGAEVPTGPSLDKRLESIAAEIIEKEMSGNSWTLMHRFNLCYDLLDRIDRDDIEGLALIFVWLRFSAVRQLDWQRKYNTKPRELGHAMERLTLKLAARYGSNPGERKIIRLIMSTLGRGSDAQRVRDEVLHIMHRHHIKEVSGHFMEEWHQKLHNNATPDDIVICEALLHFLKSDGDLAAFYRKLEEGGVTRERLESYERPIRSHPDFIPHLKEALIRDFEYFLGILKEVHSGTDLGVAIKAAQYLFDQEMHVLADDIRRRRDDSGERMCNLAEKVTEFRRRLVKKSGSDKGAVRDLVFLDLALEDFFRIIVERDLRPDMNTRLIVKLLSLSVDNMCLSHEDGQLLNCLHHWKLLAKAPDFSERWALHAKAVIERIETALGRHVDEYNLLLQPKALFLGRSFKAAPWSVALFTEEVLRGRPSFVLSLLIRTVNPILRKISNLGDWQIISPGRRTGKVKVIPGLKSIEGEHFDHPVVVITDKVIGSEEMPAGTAAVITADTVDILSHVAVRARNMNTFFAVCFNPEKIGRMKRLEGRQIELWVNTSGEVAFEESAGYPESAIMPGAALMPVISRPAFRSYVIPMEDFSRENVGGKSYNLKRMKGRLPEWIR